MTAKQINAALAAGGFRPIFGEDGLALAGWNYSTAILELLRVVADLRAQLAARES